MAFKNLGLRFLGSDGVATAAYVEIVNSDRYKDVHHLGSYCVSFVELRNLLDVLRGELDKIERDAEREFEAVSPRLALAPERTRKRTTRPTT